MRIAGIQYIRTIHIFYVYHAIRKTLPGINIRKYFGLEMCVALRLFVRSVYTLQQNILLSGWGGRWATTKLLYIPAVHYDYRTVHAHAWVMRGTHSRKAEGLHLPRLTAKSTYGRDRAQSSGGTLNRRVVPSIASHQRVRSQVRPALEEMHFRKQ